MEEDLKIEKINASSDPRLAELPESGTGFSAGDIIADRYRVMSLIGKGGMGKVYKVEQIVLHQTLALKTIDPSQTSEVAWRRFKNEAKTLANLKHPGFVRIYDFGLIDHVQPFYVMDLVDGSTLASRLKKAGTMPLDEALEIVSQVCAALDHAHNAGVIHRDIKPANLALAKDADGDLQVKILDFGIAKLQDNSGQALTRTGEIFGSPYYMSPEQCAGDPLDLRSDIYSLGCVFYEMLTGTPPFVGETALVTMMKHRNDAPASLRQSSLGKNYPQPLERIVQRLLEKNPADRYQKLQDLSADLESIQKGKSLRSRKRSGGGAVKSKGKPSIVAGLAVVIALAASLGFFLTQSLKPATISAPPLVTHADRAAPKDESTRSAMSAPGADLGGVPDVERKTWHSFRPLELNRDAKMKVFVFPQQSIGKIRILNQKSSFEAQGTVKVPSSAKIIFEPGKVLNDYPKYLTCFQPDDIYSLLLTDKSEPSNETLMFARHLTGLRALCVQNTDIGDEGLYYISELPNLIELDLGHTDVTEDGILKMKCLPKLQSLFLDMLGKTHSKIVKELPKCKSLKILVLDTMRITDNDLKEIGKIHSLTDLHLFGNTFVTDKGVSYLTGLKNLRVLNLANCRTTMASIQYLQKMPKLASLIVNGSGWSKNGEQEDEREFTSKMPNCALRGIEGVGSQKVHLGLDSNVFAPSGIGLGEFNPYGLRENNPYEINGR